eukprot:scaffold5475_cov80-Skeletonema_menzelii.AAC.1
MMRREESDYESRTEPVDEEDHDEEDSDVEDDDLSILLYSRASMTLSGLNLSYGTKFGLTRLASWM